MPDRQIPQCTYLCGHGHSGQLLQLPVLPAEAVRAVKKREADATGADGQKAAARSKEREAALLSALGARQELDRLMKIVP